MIQSIENLQKIIDYENMCWKTFCDTMRLFDDKLKSHNLEIQLEQYWLNYYEKGYKEYKNRIETLPGYTYCCRYSILKNGNILKFKYDRYTHAIYIFEFVKIRTKLILSDLFYFIGIIPSKTIVTEFNFDKDFTYESVEEDINDYITMIQNGEFIE